MIKIVGNIINKIKYIELIYRFGKCKEIYIHLIIKDMDAGNGLQ